MTCGACVGLREARTSTADVEPDASSAATQEQFDAAIANLGAHRRFVADLKNDLGQAGDLQPYSDFTINEQCWQYRECNFPAPGLQAWPSTYGKAVFNVEYKLATSKFCPQEVVRERGHNDPGSRDLRPYPSCIDTGQ